MTKSYDFLGAFYEDDEEDAAQAVDELVQGQPKAMVDLHANPSLLADKQAVKKALLAAIVAVEHACTAIEAASYIFDEADEVAGVARQRSLM